MMEDNEKVLKDLRIKRGSVKSALTRAQTSLKNFDPSKDAISLLEFRQEGLPRINQSFDEIQSQIELVYFDSEENERERDEFENRYYALRSEMQDIIGANKKQDVSLNGSHNSTYNIALQRARLPPVDLPKFDGNIQEWESFFSCYKALVHEDERYPAAQKFSYLRSALKGQALDIIKGIPMTESNYEVAITKLKQRYDNRSLVIQSHIRAILDLPQVQASSAIELQGLQSRISAHVAALKELDQPVDKWDAWLVTICLRKLDQSSNHEWQLRRTNTELPTFADIEEFLLNRCIAFEASEAGCCKVLVEKLMSANSCEKRNIRHNNPKRVFLAAKSNEPKCACCTGPHKLFACNDFKELSSGKRVDLVRNSKLCFNCLSPNHIVTNCQSNFHCGKCKQRHNTLLHFEKPSNVNQDKKHEDGQANSNHNDVEVERPSAKTLWASQSTSHVFLATAMVLIADRYGVKRECRAVLDSGSQTNFVSKKLAHILGLPRKSVSLPISGIGANHVHSATSVTLSMESRLRQFSVTLVCHVLTTIVDSLAQGPNNSESLQIPSEYIDQLADPTYLSSEPIDLLVGGGTFFDLLESERVYLGQGSLCLQNTKLGWVLAGELGTVCLLNVNSVGQSIEEDWVAIEKGKESTYGGVSKTNRKILEEQEAARHFHDTVTRNSDGRFVLRLPLKPEVDNLGDTLGMATSRFLSVERRLQRDEKLRMAYVTFMAEYEKAGHMQEIINENALPRRSCYLPHHPVIKESSLTTKLRVVFDASAKSSTGVSLNDVLMCGPTVQEELFSILVRFRKHQYVITADVEKMFRQVAVAKEDQDLQRIVWRAAPSDELRSYRLTTVTYGTTSASYMATQCLSSLAESERKRYPKASVAIGRDFYMDDLITGAETVEECISLHAQINAILGSAKFPLRKWCSNSAHFLESTNAEENEPLFMIKTEADDVVKSLGLYWKPSKDVLGFQVVATPKRIKVTKRMLLSDLNRIFDPLGFLTPVLIRGKIFLQQLWQLKIDWDMPLSIAMKLKWELFYQSLDELALIPIPRKCNPYPGEFIELHGFCDASQEAYGACIFVRCKDESGQWHSHLLCSRSRVAPLRGATIPRLELCGALVLTRLAEKVATAWGLDIAQFYFWTDSMVVLGWLNCQASRLKTYVANRTEQILEVTQVTQWRHVVSNENPADAVSRGVSPAELKESTLWWNGPHWLSEPEGKWNPSSVCVKQEELPEQRKIKLALVAASQYIDLVHIKSHWNQLVRAIAWLALFVDYIKAKKNIQVTKYLTVVHLKRAEAIILKRVQNECFPKEAIALANGKEVARTSKLKSLYPLMQDGIILVGGRLQNSDISYSQKHPIVLPANHRVTLLIFEKLHREMLHCGPQALLAEVRRRYWPLMGRRTARAVVRKCVKCIRASPKFTTPLMGQLPKDRVQMSRPFSMTGVDFAGPFIVRSGIRRVTGKKAWICVFICFATRAVHLEIVEEMTSDAFMACLRRFISRRGRCAVIHSDNGTNFVGAQRELASIIKGGGPAMANEGIEWRFNPPSGPHFGGLWEAAVKSAKYHLKRIMGETKLTLAELSTLVCQIEACLNSRPITPMGSDPDEPEALTPAHFLVGGPLTLPPEPDRLIEAPGGLKRWKHVQYLLHLFWRRWYTEYLPQCQVRGKWVNKRQPLKTNDIVIIKEDNLPPTKWNLGRITQVHPGKDGAIRVVTVRTAAGTEVKRPAVKLCALPTEEATILVEK